jgi:hypothetical protein
MKLFDCSINRSPKLWRPSAAPVILCCVWLPAKKRLYSRTSWFLWSCCALLAILWISLGLAASPAPAEDASRTRWTEEQGAQVKLGGKIPIMWDLYQPDKKEKKKDNLVLVLLGRRYLMLDTKAKLAYEVKPSALHAEGKDFTSDDLAATSRLIPTTDWAVRDVGPSELIDVTLGDYGGELEVQIPHPLILTPPVHYF